MFSRALVLAFSLAGSAALAETAKEPIKEAPLPSLAPLIEAVKGAVVNVDVQKRAAPSQLDLFERFARRRGQQNDDGEESGPVNAGTGSGFIIDPKGILITNNHVVENAVAIKVRLGDGRSFDGEIVGRDPLTDVAV